MGAAGDMLAAALLELLPDPDEFIGELNALDISGVQFRKEPSVKCGIAGTRLTVLVNGEEERNDPCDHHCGALYDIERIIQKHPALPQKVQDDIMAVYRLIAEAESRVCGVPMAEIHFREAGAMDAFADIMAVCMLIHRLSPDEVIVSPVHVGSGQVKGAYGTFSVPAPATADILKEVPIYGGSVRGELCTLTGAALLKYFAAGFGSIPVMKTRAIGYGMGRKDFEEANCVRAMLGETDDTGYEICELNCNVDDMTGEEIGFAAERLFDAGALEVYTVPIGMKKSRPGILICILCRRTDRETIVQTVFKYTTTIGIRESMLQRYVLDRHMETSETPYGAVRCKVSSGYGVERRKYEYEDLSRIAGQKGISIPEVVSLINKST